MGDIVAQTPSADQIGPRISPELRQRIAAKNGAKNGAKNAAKSAARSTAKAPVARPAPAVAKSSARPTSTATPAEGAGSFAPVLPPKDYSPPDLFIENKRHDFGSVFQGDEVVHTFEIENRGGADLVIQRIKPSCGCTYVDHDRVIKPGEKGSVTLKIDTKRLRAGTQSKSADVFSNDPDASKEKLYISGKVTTIFEIDPKYPRIESVAGVASPSTEIKLTKTVEGDFKITGVSRAPTTASTADTPARLSSELEPIDDANYKLLVTALTKEGEKSRNFYEKLVVDIAGPDGKTFQQEMSVTVRFKERISITPRTVWFRRNEVDMQRKATAAAASASGATAPEVTKASKTVKLKSEVEDFNFNITKIESTDPHFAVSHSPIAEGSEYEVKIELDKLPTDAGVRSLKGDVIVHTDDPANPQIKFRVIAYL